MQTVLPTSSTKTGECNTCHNWFNSKYGGEITATTKLCGGCHTTKVLLESINTVPTLENLTPAYTKRTPKLVSVGLDFDGICSTCKEDIQILERYSTERGWVFIKEHVGTNSPYCLAS